MNHEFPGPNYHFETGDPRIRPPTPSTPRFIFSLYWAMTGLHAFHMIIGVGLVLWIMIVGLRGAFSPAYYTPVENVGLYWHFSTWCGSIYFHCSI